MQTLLLENVELGDELTWTLKIPHVCLRAGSGAAIVGDNGAGKTMLLRTIAGELPAPKGRLEAVRAVLVTERAGYFPDLTVEEHARVLTIDERRVSQLSSVVGARSDVVARFLSFGQQRVLAVATSLLAGRALILLDEPFAGLGKLLRARLLALLCDHLTFGGSIVMTSPVSLGDVELPASVVNYSIRDGVLYMRGD